MDQYEKQLLEQTLKLAEENNKMLHSMRRQAHWAQVWGFIKLLLIIVPLVWSYYYLQPYLQQIQNFYQQTQKMQSGSESFLQRVSNMLPSLESQPSSEPTTTKIKK